MIELYQWERSRSRPMALTPGLTALRRNYMRCRNVGLERRSHRFLETLRRHYQLSWPVDQQTWCTLFNCSASPSTGRDIHTILATKQLRYYMPSILCFKMYNTRKGFYSRKFQTVIKRPSYFGWWKDPFVTKIPFSPPLHYFRFIYQIFYSNLFPLYSSFVTLWVSSIWLCLLSPHLSLQQTTHSAHCDRLEALFLLIVHPSPRVKQPHQLWKQ